jgi:4-hydroxy-tetrahydrodipicolinate reductase
MINAIIAGAGGRMGGRIIANIMETLGINVKGAFEHSNHPLIGQDAGIVAVGKELNVKISSDLKTIIKEGDVIIDFTHPDASLEHIKIAHEFKKPIVVGTTGINSSYIQEISKAFNDIPCVIAPNMSVGVNLLYKLIDLTTRVLGEDYDIEIVEAHHRMKKDAPSGTALQLARVAAQARGKNLEEVGVFERNGMIGERKKGEIGLQTIRCGDIVGEHNVMFATTGERIELVHKASSRDTFAKGAIRAALWVYDKDPGLYNMQDVLGLKDI